MGLASARSKVIESRTRVEDEVIVRRRVCDFGHRQTTVEVELEEWRGTQKDILTLRETLYTILKEKRSEHS